MKSYKCNDKLNHLRNIFWNAKFKDKNLYDKWGKIKRA